MGFHLLLVGETQGMDNTLHEVATAWDEAF